MAPIYDKYYYAYGDYNYYYWRSAYNVVSAFYEGNRPYYFDFYHLGGYVGITLNTGRYYYYASEYAPGTGWYYWAAYPLKYGYIGIYITNFSPYESYATYTYGYRLGNRRYYGYTFIRHSGGYLSLSASFDSWYEDWANDTIRTWFGGTIPNPIYGYDYYTISIAYYAYTAPKYYYNAIKTRNAYYQYTPAIETNPIHYSYTEV